LISLSAKPKPQIYVPHPQFAVQGMSLIVRTQIEPATLTAALRTAVNEIDPNVPLYRPRTLLDYLASSIAQPRFHALLVTLFSVIALLLAAAGIFGVMSFAVTQRTHEIGIRLALGAQRGDVLRLILGEGMQLVALGVAAGIAGVFAMSRVLRTLLYGITATDPPTILMVTTVLAFVAFLACWWPARRASSVDPMVALRSQ
jgi:putative ABC transport system permease protein